jgi:hypothetical protein
VQPWPLVCRRAKYKTRLTNRSRSGVAKTTTDIPRKSCRLRGRDRVVAAQYKSLASVRFSTENSQETRSTAHTSNPPSPHQPPTTHLTPCLTDHHSTTTTKSITSTLPLLLAATTAQAWWCNDGTFGNGDCEKMYFHGKQAKSFCCSGDQRGEFRWFRNGIGRQNDPNGGTGCGFNGVIICSVDY